MGKILLTGLPGAGKTTQGILVAKELNLHFFSMGNFLRDLVSNRSDNLLARKILDFWQNNTRQWQPLPDDLMFAAYQLGTHNRAVDIVDGFPRNTNQLKSFLEIDSLQQILVLCITPELAQQRIVNRARGAENDNNSRQRLKIEVARNEQFLSFAAQFCPIAYLDGSVNPEAISQNIKSLILRKST